jgi:cytochrome P450
VKQLEPRIRELAVGYIDRILETESVDFIADFAGKLPMDVISELMGVPAADRDEIRRLADLLVHREDGMRGVPAAGVEAAFELVAYYADLIADRRTSPRDDLTSALTVAEVDGDRLTDNEIIAFLSLMIVAGNETTTKLLGNAVYWGHRNPAQLDSVLADAGRVPKWVEETLRYDTSTQLLARFLLKDLKLYGHTAPAGSKIVLLVGSANRDEAVFPHGDDYDLDRDTTQTASFGGGRHYCLGANLARLEANIVLDALVERVGRIEVDEAGAARVHSVNVRGFAKLPVTLHAR